MFVRCSACSYSAHSFAGGYFDPLGLASGDDARAFKLKEAELKHGRLAMIAFLGFGVQALATGQGALGSLAKFASSFAPELVEDIEKAAGKHGVRCTTHRIPLHSMHMSQQSVSAWIASWSPQLSQ
jgi:hypothetical protein